MASRREFGKRLIVAAGVSRLSAAWEKEAKHHGVGILVSVLCLVMLVPVTFAQIDRGTIKGRITDSSDAVIPEASVQIIRIDTNSTLQVVTDSQGLYNVPNLPPGTYRVTVAKEGFKTGVREPVEVRPTVQVQVDFRLDPGAVTETVQVTAEAPMLDVSTTNNATGLKSEQIHELPLILVGTKRIITQFLPNLPGYNGGGTFGARANGAQAGNTEVFIDGARASEQISRGAVDENSPMIEQVGDFNVVTNAFNAEYGGFGSWFTTATIKSGTNSLHGSVFDHFSNSALNAKNWFAASKTFLNQHEGGFTLGGPVVIPHLYNGRNKTFFFGSLGLFFSRQGASGNLTTVPLPEFVGKGSAFPGDFDFRKLGVNIYDPATSRPGPNGTVIRDVFTCHGVQNVICGDRISPVTRQLLQYIPAPQLPGLTNNYHSNAAPTWPYYNTYVPLIKVDHNISNAQKLSVMYTNQVRHRELWTGGLTPSAIWGAPQTNPIDYQTDQIANSWKFRINHDYIISNNVLNHFTFGADRYINREPNKTNGQGWDQKLGITGIPADNGVFPAIAFSGGTLVTPATFGRAWTQNWFELNTSYIENLTWNHGKHTMKFGGEVGTTGINNFQQGGVGGSFTFSSFTTSSGSALAGGNSFASFLLGLANSASARIPVETGLRFRRYALFGQDDWRMTPKLTLSYGLRWDYQPPYFEVNNKLSSFVPDLPNPGAGGLPGALAFAGGKYGRSFQQPWKRGFGPRLGVAYQLNPKTLFRASSGVYYGIVANGTFSAGGVTITPLGYTSTPTFTSPNNFDPIMDWARQPFPQNFSRPPSTDPSFANGQAIPYIPRIGDRLPQIVSWTVSIQRELARNLSAEVSYLGNHSTHLAMPAAASAINIVPIEKLSLGSVLLQPITSPAAVNAGFNQPFPGFANQIGANTVAQALKPYPQYTSVDMNSALLPEGEAKYNSLQVKGTKRFSGGLSLLAFLTWSKQITNSAVTGQVQYPGYHAFTIDPLVVPLVFSSSWTYELPLGAGKRFFSSNSGIVSRLISGWRVNGFVRYTSGAPLLITTNNNLGPLGYPGKLADRIADVPATLVTNPRDFVPGVTGSRYLNPAAFAAPALFALGNTGGYLGDVRGFTQKQEAISFGKVTKLSERTAFELTADFTNPFNFHRWNDPATNISSPSTFGRVTGAQAPRQVQINGSITF